MWSVDANRVLFALCSLLSSVSGSFCPVRMRRGVRQLCFRIASRPLKMCGLHRRVSCAVTLASLPTCYRGPLAGGNRHQSSLTEKRFHCSVCQKSFRLEMAANLHLQQAHNGDGAIIAGAGPGQGESATQTTASVFTTAPPQGPTTVTTLSALQERRPHRRERPTPKPLHKPDVVLPPSVMEELLGVWDLMGLRRLEGMFIHSSMIMKVFAAKPDDHPLYDPVVPEGDNPFQSQVSNHAVASIAHGGVNGAVLDNAFVLASDVSYGPFRPASCPNPLSSTATTEVAKVRPKQVPVAEEPADAPVTPYGKLPKFGEHLLTPHPSSDTASATVASPFAAAVQESPFAGHVDSPFATATSPFVSSEEALAPPVETAPSPFTSPGAASPFVVEGCAVEAADYSPFGTLHPYIPGTPADVSSFTSSSAKPETPPPEHPCESCGRTFTSHEGLRMHAKAKHGIDLPRKTVKKKQSIPELPAYIPSPVDLSMTTPFGSERKEQSWAETEVIPHAVSVSNITLTGRVLDIEPSKGGQSYTHITIFVNGETREDSERLTVLCASTNVPVSLQREDTVFVCGTLRLLPTYENRVNKYYSTPAVLVASPTGIMCKVS